MKFEPFADEQYRSVYPPVINDGNEKSLSVNGGLELGKYGPFSVAMFDSGGYAGFRICLHRDFEAT